VAKQITTIDGRQVLVEAVEWRDVKEQLERLPRKSASIEGTDSTIETASRALPPSLPAASPDAEKPPVLLAQAPLEKGFVLDYTTVSSGSSITTVRLNLNRH
jgi:hypothetical protein